MKTPETVAELIAWFEANFDSWTGPARAVVRIPTGLETGVNFVYDTYAVKTREPGDVEKRLVLAMFESFQPVVADERIAGTALIWRLPEKFLMQGDHVRILGDRLATQDEVADNVKPEPAGAVVDTVTGDWYADLGTRAEWTLRTRLVIPALEFAKLPPLGFKKWQGAEAIYI